MHYHDSVYFVYFPKDDREVITIGSISKLISQISEFYKLLEETELIWGQFGQIHTCQKN